MKREEVEIIINENGEIKIETKGIKGKRCEEMALSLEKVLGKIIKKERKPEYYEKEISIVNEIKIKK